MMHQRIIIGTGNEELDELIKKDIEDADMGQVVAKVTTRNILLKRVMETDSSLVIIGDDLIGNDGSDTEWELIIEELRNISIQLRIVFLCDRSEDDLFLTRLTTYSVFDIFSEGSLPPDYIKQLSNPPEYKNIQRFKKLMRKATEDMIQEQKEREAEKIIRNGVLPQSDQLIKTTVPVYERLLIPPQLVVIASAFEGAGSSMFGRMFAEYLASLRLHVGLLESPFIKPSWYDLLNTKNNKDKSEDWTSWHHNISKDIPISAGQDITIRDVSYIIRDRREHFEDWDFMKTAQLVGMGRQVPILLYDISSNMSDEREKLVLKQANHIFLVTSFDPVRVNRDFEKYEHIAKEVTRDRITVICNRSTKSLEKKYGEQLKKSYSVDNMYYLPQLESMNEIIMDGVSVWDRIEGAEWEEFNQLFRRLSSDLLGNEIIKKLQPDTKEKGFFSKMFASK